MKQNHVLIVVLVITFLIIAIALCFARRFVGAVAHSILMNRLRAETQHEEEAQADREERLAGRVLELQRENANQESRLQRQANILARQNGTSPIPVYEVMQPDGTTQTVRIVPA